LAKDRTRYVCQACGSPHPKWQGRCDACGEWNTLVEEVAEPQAWQT
jgi:DNA repair protein RadA/Sms